MKKVWTTAVVLTVLAISALGLPVAVGVFDKTYGIAKDSALGKAKCLVCHADKKGKKFNPYGLDLKKTMKAAGVKKLNPKILHAIDKLDSNRNGQKNIDEIKADSLPGKK